MSVLKGEQSIIIRLPYDVSIDDFTDSYGFASVIYEGIVRIWYYVHEEQHIIKGCVRDKVYIPKYDCEPLKVSQYPSKTYMMYRDLLDFINQYMQIELNFSDFIGITENSITDGMYHSDLMFAYCIDIEFDDLGDD